MATRLLFPIGIFIILLLKEKQITKRARLAAYILSFVCSLAFIVLVYAPDSILPDLVDVNGVTALKSSLQMTAFAFTILLLLLLVKQMREIPRRAILMIAASLNLLCSDLMFVSYVDVYDIYNFTGHIFQLIAYWLLFKSIYYSTVDKPFLALMSANEALESKERKITQMAYYDAGTRLPNERY